MFVTIVYILHKEDRIHRFIMTIWDEIFLLLGFIAGIEMTIECNYCDFNWWGNNWYYIQMATRLRNSHLSNTAFSNSL